MPHDPLRESVDRIDSLLTAVREALVKAAVELEDGPLATSDSRFSHAVAATLRSLSGLVGIAGAAQQVEMLDALAYGLHVAVEGVREVIPHVRAVIFVRDDVDVADRAAQREVCAQVCAARGWSTGPVIYQGQDGLRGWAAALRLVHAGCDVVIVDSLDRLGPNDDARLSVLALLLRHNLRIVAARDGVDTGDPVGRALAESLIA
ncbi:recombinase family protein [Frankia sp. AiPs1]|uniref:recombinase family protein n=1 Tax=Frankia sp. AiPs1 TaxID=573493 RepID=UPI002043ED80|nr:recombinase family protein [Frankia sp. AiPs1]